MNIINYFLNAATLYPDHGALVVNGESYSYRQLRIIAGKTANRLKGLDGKNVGIFACRSLSAYAGILATLQAGKTYVPLNPKYPIIRNQNIIDLSGSKILIVDNQCLKLIPQLSVAENDGLTLLCPETAGENIPADLDANHDILSADDLDTVMNGVQKVAANDLAYIMFTSGSTGIPKGVPVSHGNVRAYVEYLHKRYDTKPEDRFSQTFDITFDLSVHDMFLAWRGGASLYSVPESKLMAPAKFIKQNELTMWFSVPSLAQFMNRFRMLKPGTFPSLRYSLFCGEPLPKSIAIAWQKAADHSIVENIYGPTEATIGIAHYRLPVCEDEIKERNGVVAIGQIFDTQGFCLTDESGHKTANEGELCLVGSQVTQGYWQNKAKTKEQFFRFEENGPTHYRTGDIVEVEGDMIYYKSRKDFQVKIRGFRVELDEINLAIANFNGASVVCTIPYPIHEGVADNLIAFVDAQSNQDTTALLKYLATVLPDYMIPNDIYYIDDFPLNANGKIDRKQLVQQVKGKDHERYMD